MKSWARPLIGPAALVLGARISGKIDPHLHEDVVTRAGELGISDSQLLESALTHWLASNT